ncbi:acyltransferase family protein [Nocardioides sp. URHA0020]|uniref:acyltransferase family protein n=1 Tax=Nocardioides sp. URHA0020 TaxID=1380392 RepID=UPI00068795BB|nr:acyltransferase family protein [Nocardioides sp. URHA0020]
MTTAPTTATPSATAPTSAPSSGVRGDIEGLRAIAVGVVVLYHVGVTALSGGFAGVDVFFVISGFLITGLLLREVDRTGSVSITRFYARRVRRLVPAATVVLLFTAVVGYAVMPGSTHVDLGKDTMATATYVVNWVLAFRSVDYLAEGAAESPLQHYWSLSVEEQYYVFWPLLILVGVFIARRTGWRPRRVLLVVIGAAAAASLVYSAVHTRTSPATAYFFTTTRVWELAIGSLLSFGIVRLRTLPRRVAELLAWAGLAAIAYAVLVFSSETAWPGTAALVPTLGAAAVIASGCAVTATPTSAARLLGTRPMTWLGGISYSVYLWHWPLLILAGWRWPDISGLSLGLIGLASIPLAWLSKRLIEDPIRFAPRLTASTSLALTLGAVLMSVSVITGLLIVRSVPTLQPGGSAPGARALVANPDGKVWRLVDDPTRLYTRSGKVVPDPAVATEDVPSVNACQMPIEGTKMRTDCVRGNPRSDTTVAMLGDSKMEQWYPALKSIAHSEDWRLELYLKSACTVSTVGVSDDCAAYNRKVTAWFETHGVPDYTIVSVRGSSYDDETRGLDASLAQLKEMGTKVIVLADNISPDSDALYRCVEENPGAYQKCSFDRARGEATSGAVPLKAAAEELDLPYVDINKWICPPGPTCPAVIAHTLIYRQGSHVTRTYIKTLTPMLHRALSRVGIAKQRPGTIALHAK